MGYLRGWILVVKTWKVGIHDTQYDTQLLSQHYVPDSASVSESSISMAASPTTSLSSPAADSLSFSSSLFSDVSSGESTDSES